MGFCPPVLFLDLLISLYSGTNDLDISRSRVFILFYHLHLSYLGYTESCELDKNITVPCILLESINIVVFLLNWFMMVFGILIIFLLRVSSAFFIFVDYLT